MFPSMWGILPLDRGTLLVSLPSFYSLLCRVGMSYLIGKFGEGARTTWLSLSLSF